MITASGVSLRNVNVRNLVQVDFDGKVRESKGLTPSKEFRLHTAVYVNKPDVNAVVHVPSPSRRGSLSGGVSFPC